MSTNRLDVIDNIVIEPEIVATTLRVLQHFGSHGCEGLVLWVGTMDANRAQITKAVVPDQQPMKSEEGVGYFVDATTLFELNRTLAETGLRLIAQIHSHPSDAYHSEADDRYAIVTANGGLSLVVPNFGRAPADPTLWAIYRLHDGLWHELNMTQARALLKLGQIQK